MMGMGKVAVGKAAGGFEQAIGIRSRKVHEKGWCGHKMSREQLVGITGQNVQTSGGREVLVAWRGRGFGRDGHDKWWRIQYRWTMEGNGAGNNKKGLGKGHGAR